MNRLLLFVLSCTSIAFLRGAEKNPNEKPASPTPAIKIPARQFSKPQSPKLYSSSVPAFPGQGYIPNNTPKTPTTPSSCPAEVGFDFPSSFISSNLLSPDRTQQFAQYAAIKEAAVKSKKNE